MTDFKDMSARERREMQHKEVLRVCAKLLIPLIMTFALYVQFHGDFGPGGGFQAGVIFASAFILYALLFGVSQARRVAPASVIRTALALGLLLYAGTGVAGWLLGGNYLNYSVLADDPVAGLDCSALQDHLLGPVLGIEDPRRSTRITFVGGIHGPAELKRQVDAGKAVAFHLFPTGLDQLFEVADAGKVMPPKSTWFEPKLREGVAVRLLR